MSTELLYLHDDYLDTFEATVLSVDDRSLILDATSFYPTGGHQHCDQGVIEKNPGNYVVVDDVQDDGYGVVHHYIEASKGEIHSGDKVTGRIKWDRRFRHMQLHTAQHVFSYHAQSRFGVETRRSDFSPEAGLMVLYEPLSWEQCVLLEEDVNGSIDQALDVSRSIDDVGLVTISIVGLGQDHCGGTHVKSTSEIDMFKITSMHDRNIYYEVGRSARRVAVRMANAALELATVLEQDKGEDIGDSLKMLVTRQSETDQRLNEIEDRLTQSLISLATKTSKRLADGTLVFQIDLSHVKTKEAKLLLKEMVTENQVWICMAAARSLLIKSETDAVSARKIIQEFGERWGMRGGGNPGYAQGGPVPDPVANPLGEIAQWLEK